MYRFKGINANFFILKTHWFILLRNYFLLMINCYCIGVLFVHSIKPIHSPVLFLLGLQSGKISLS